MNARENNNFQKSYNFNDELKKLQVHDHLCLIYETSEEWQCAISFIKFGIEKGEKCLYVVDTHTASQILGYLQEEGINVTEARMKGQLVILHQTEVCTRGGYFDANRMIAHLIAETEKAIAEGYSALRITGGMTWVLKELPGSETILEYEAKLNQYLFPKYPCLALCQYNRWEFDPEIIKGVVMTHPVLVRGNRIYRNFYYIPPEEFLITQHAGIEVQHWLHNIELEHKSREALQESEEKYRTLIEKAPVGICIVQDTGKGPQPVFANQRLADMWGFSTTSEALNSAFVKYPIFILNAKTAHSVSKILGR